MRIGRINENHNCPGSCTKYSKRIQIYRNSAHLVLHLPIAQMKQNNDIKEYILSDNSMGVAEDERTGELRSCPPMVPAGDVTEKAAEIASCSLECEEWR